MSSSHCDLINFEMMGEDINGNIIGRHVSTGIARPAFWGRARYYNEDQRLATILDTMEVAGSHQI